MPKSERLRCKVFRMLGKTALGITDSGDLVLIALWYRDLVNSGLAVGDSIVFVPEAPKNTAPSTAPGQYDIKYFARYPRKIWPSHAAEDAEVTEENWAAKI
jgi:hypothetical protein